MKKINENMNVGTTVSAPRYTTVECQPRKIKKIEDQQTPQLARGEDHELQCAATAHGLGF